MVGCLFTDSLGFNVLSCQSFKWWRLYNSDYKSLKSSSRDTDKFETDMITLKDCIAACCEDSRLMMTSFFTIAANLVRVNTEYLIVGDFYAPSVDWSVMFRKTCKSQVGLDTLCYFNQPCCKSLRDFESNFHQISSSQLQPSSPVHF